MRDPREIARKPAISIINPVARSVSHSNRRLDEILRRIEWTDLKVDRGEKSAKHVDHLLPPSHRLLPPSSSPLDNLRSPFPLLPSAARVQCCGNVISFVWRKTEAQPVFALDNCNSCMRNSWKTKECVPLYNLIILKFSFYRFLGIIILLPV